MTSVTVPVTTIVEKYIYTVGGTDELKGGIFESCFIAYKECTEEEILLMFNSQCPCRFKAKTAVLDCIEYLTVDLIKNQVVKVEKEQV